MYIYILTLIIGWLLWRFVRFLRTYWILQERLNAIPVLPASHWLLGITPKVQNFDDVCSLIHRYLDDVPTKWFQLSFMIFQPVMMPVHPDTIKPFLLASDLTKDSEGYSGYKMIKPWIGDGLLVSNGEKWERNRKLLTPAFHFDVLKPYTSVFCQCTDIFLDKLKPYANSGLSVDIFPYVVRLTLHALLPCLLSYNDSTIQDTVGEHPYVAATHKLKNLLMKRLLTPYLFPDWTFKRSKIGREFKEQSDFIHDFSQKYISARKKEMKESSCTEEKRHLDFLDILLSARDENGVGLTDQEIRDEVDTFVFEGHDTTASAVSWIINSLAKFPQYQHQVRQEVLDVLGDRDEPTNEDLPNLSFMTCFIKESLRMYPPVPGISRTLNKSITVDGVTFPKGQGVDIYTYSLHHNPEVWENHWEFQPERFSPENIQDRDPFSFLPFSAGHRNCIGQNFAMNEMKVIVCKLMKRYEITTDPTRPAEPFPEIIMGAKDGIYLHFKEF